MGHALNPFSTSAPLDATAGPSLIPDLITRIPWPRWTLFIAILAAGVLLVSCLLCVICCYCHRHRHRKQPKDKETVGLGSARNSTTTHLVQPDVDCLEPCSGGDQQWGRLLLSLEYDFGSQEVRLTQQVQRLCG